ncbi:MAG: type II toxin-antitoxin system VapC family toxin [Planctomycetes bacterium]|nr:type II toxin-antitoxin system VapC family toxin [Planctomycetota bacterium]
MTLRFAVDTNIISAACRPRPPNGLLRRLDDHSSEIALPTPVWHELRYGVALLEASARRDHLERFLTDVVLVSFPLLPYDKPAAEWHASERARLQRDGRPGPFVDGQIAAIAYVNDLILVTDNLRVFKRFHGLRLANWL